MASKKSLNNASVNQHSGIQPGSILPSEISIRNPRASHLSSYRETILEMHLETVRSVLDGLQRAIVCGCYLLDVKAILPHGSFTTWIQENFAASTGLSERSAQRYMKSAQGFAKFLHSRGHGSIDESISNTRLLLERVQEYHEDGSRETAAEKSVPIDPNDWLTPTSVAAAVVQVLGSLDCDPCATETGPSLAEIQYTKKEDGLAQPWPGAVWVAPGHSGIDFTPWCHKALGELKSGNLTEAILCLPEATLRQVPELYRYPIAISFSPLVVTYSASSNCTQKTLPTCSTFVYLTTSPRTELFATAFKEIAAVFSPVTPGMK